MDAMTPRWTELLMADHEMTERVFDAVAKGLAAPAPAASLVADALEYFTGYVERRHSHKEEDHLFPLLVALGMPMAGGPLAVMVMEHRRSEEALARLNARGRDYIGGDASALADVRAAFADYAAILKEHFWKENDILFPMARRAFSAAEHERATAGIAAVEASLGPDTHARYAELARRIVEGGDVADLSANLSPEVLAAVLNTLPIELSFVDEHDRVRYFSHEHGAKIFPRSRGAVGRTVQQCHPPKSVDKVTAILESFKRGTRDVAEFWLDMRGRKIHVRYFAVRGAEGRYLGTLETVQDITPLQRIEGERRLVEEALA